jgi:FkbM family methyltransferase
LLAAIVRAGTAVQRPRRRVVTQAMVGEALDPRIVVPLPEGELVFACPTRRAALDPLNILTGEPETIRWLDRLPEGAVLWDIGANVGTYALYAARRRRARVLAFEPSAATYAVLCDNIHRNRLDGLIDAYCVALSDRTGLDKLYMMNAGAGHSVHAFGRPETIAGRMDNPVAQAAPGFTIDDFTRQFAPPPPEHVKLDVDSIEARIIEGGAETLRRHTQSVMVEIEGNAGRDQAIRQALAAAGFAEDLDFARPGDRRNVLFKRKG